MEAKPGDRYRVRELSPNDVITYITEYTGEGCWVVIEGDNPGSTIRYGDWPVRHTNYWEFIGNYGKVDNFTELYDLFNS